MVSTVMASTKDAQTDDLVLRIRGTSRHGQIVRLQAEKCTIGSGPRCTLRLRARGVQSLHCLIVRGPDAAVIRRWHPDTRLNGHAFTESLLSPGDRLSVGPLEFEVLKAIRSGEPSDAAELPPSETSEPHDTEAESTGQDLARLRRQHEELEQRRHELDSLTATLNQREQSLAESVARLEAREVELAAQRQALEQQRGRCEAERAEAEKDLQAREAALEAQRRSLAEERQRKEAEEDSEAGDRHARMDELSVRGAELEAQQQAFEELRQRWEAERSNSETQLHARREELKIQQAECESRQRGFEEQHQRWEAERAGAEQALRARQAELEAQRQTLEQRCQRLEAERAEVEKDLLGRREELDARQAEIEAAREAFEEERRLWEAQRVEATSREDGADAEEEPASRPSEPAPLSSLEILRRMGNLPDLSDDEEPQDANQLADKSPSMAGHSRQGHSPRPSHADNEEESIDDYMARLLERVRGVAGETAGSAESSRSRRKEESPIRETIPIRPAAEPSASRPVSGKRREPVELSPRAVAPEKSVNLTAMREVANLSAQTAIDCHSRRLLRRVVVTKLIIAFLGLVGGCVLLWVWRAVPNRLTFSAAMASFVASLFWGIQYFVLVAPRFQRRRSMPEASRRGGEPSDGLLPSVETSPGTEATPQETEDPEACSDA